MRKSIALFLTLIFVMVIIAIVDGIFAIYKKFNEDTFYKDISQNSVLISNIKTVLNNVSKEINGSNIKNIFITASIYSKEGDFRVLISVKPLFNRVDINEVAKNKYVRKYLDNILEYYQVADPLFFKDLILDTIDFDDKERSGGSEIVLKNKFFKQGKIYNYKHLMQILNYYEKIMDDRNIYKIPWQRLFFFGDGNSIIDCNLISSDVAKFLGLKVVGNDISCKSLETFEKNKKIMKKLSIIPFNKQIDYLVQVDIVYNGQNLSIIYNINKKRIKNIKDYILY